jgi:membrane associated rhomboid family serine protease/ribosomal protein L40E
MAGSPKRDEKDWVDLVTRLAAALGMSPVRVRWKLEGWRKKASAARFRVGEQVEHVRYEHKICPACGRLNDGEATACARCGQRLGAWHWHALQRIGLSVPSILSVSSLLGLAMVLVYGRLLLAAGEGEGILDFDVETLLHFGGNWSPATLGGRELWRLGTSIFLHAGLWHLGFNLLALAQLGPPVEEVFGRGRMLLFFMLTGLAASLGSALSGGLLALVLTGSLAGFGGGVSIGASGAIMGLTGLAAGWGQRDGTTAGRQIRNRMLGWSLLVVLLGTFIGADNVAHVVGFLVGGLVGLVTPPTLLQRRPSAPAVVTQAALGGVAALAAVVLCLVPPPSPADRMMERLQRIARGEASMEGEFERGCRALEEGTFDELPWYDAPSLPTFGFTDRQRRIFLRELCQARRQEQLCDAFRSRGVDAVVEAGRRVLPDYAPDERARGRLEAIYRQRCRAIGYEVPEAAGAPGPEEPVNPGADGPGRR